MGAVTAWCAHLQCFRTSVIAVAGCVVPVMIAIPQTPRSGVFVTIYEGTERAVNGEHAEAPIAACRVFRSSAVLSAAQGHAPCRIGSHVLHHAETTQQEHVKTCASAEETRHSHGRQAGRVARLHCRGTLCVCVCGCRAIQGGRAGSEEGGRGDAGREGTRARRDTGERARSVTGPGERKAIVCPGGYG